MLFVGRIAPHTGVLIEALPAGLGLDGAGAVLNERFMRDLRSLATGKDVRFHHDWDHARLAEADRAALAVVVPCTSTPTAPQRGPGAARADAP